MASPGPSLSSSFRGGSEGASAASPGFGGAGRSPGGAYPGPGGPGSGGGTGDNSLLNPHPWDRPIEIYGIVYIYNPVDAEKLKLKDPGGTTAIAGATPGVPAAKPGPVAPTTPAPTAPGPAAPAVPAVPSAPAGPGPTAPG